MIEMMEMIEMVEKKQEIVIFVDIKVILHAIVEKETIVIINPIATTPNINRNTNTTNISI